MAGRPRKSKRLLELSGAFDKNPARALERECEPVGHAEVGPPPPEFMNPDSPTAIKHLELWNRFLAEAPPGCITGSDRTRLRNLCLAQAALERNPKSVGLHSAVERYLAKFGMTPDGRADLGVRGKNKQEEEDGREGWASLARGQKGNARLN